MNVPLLDLRAQYATIREDVRAAVDGVLENQRFILGPEVAQLEEEIAAYCEVPHAVAVASGTDALLLAMKALGVGPGDSVVTVPYTFFATAGAVVNLGARPVFVDIERAGFTMDARRLEDFFERECTCNITARKVTHKASSTTVKVIMPVHLYGQCADMDEIVEIARRYNLAVVEDACQAIGSRYKGRRAGGLGALGCFSFFPSKNLGGAGDGGMVVSADKALAERVRLLRGHGAQPKYHHKIVGFNSRLDEIQAAILRVKLRHLEGWSSKRRANAERLERDFRSAGLLQYLTPPVVLADRDHIYHQYVIRCLRRDELQSHLRDCGIGTEVYYPVPLHEQECFSSLGYVPADCPNSHQASKESLALPIYPELTDDQRAHVVASIGEFYRKGA